MNLIKQAPSDAKLLHLAFAVNPFGLEFPRDRYRKDYRNTSHKCSTRRSATQDTPQTKSCGHAIECNFECVYFLNDSVTIVLCTDVYYVLVKCTLLNAFSIDITVNLPGCGVFPEKPPLGRKVQPQLQGLRVFSFMKLSCIFHSCYEF